MMPKLLWQLKLLLRAHWSMFFFLYWHLLPFLLCSVHNEKCGHEKNTVNRMISMGTVDCGAKREQQIDAMLTICEHFANIMFCMCSELSSCFPFRQTTLYNDAHQSRCFPSCWRRACSVLFKACASDRITVRHWMSHHFYFRSQSNFP